MKISFQSDSGIIAAEVWVKDVLGKRCIKMAVDTGSTYSIIPSEIAEAIGCEPASSKDMVTLITASGVEKAPRVNVALQVWGKKLKKLKVVCHSLPPKAYVDGLLGIDALRLLKAVINFKHSFMEID